MANSNVSAKSKGIIIFAFNTQVDYVSIADLTSRLAAHNLQLPITLVTDDTTTPTFAYDQIIRINPERATFRINDGKEIAWRNRGRYNAYELSPYDTTILLDVDYLMLDNSLLKIADTVQDYRLMHHNTTDIGPAYEEMGETSLPFVWATVVVFKKTERSQMLFNLVGKIQRNYHYYRELYNIREGNYRNDYAFAIANNILSGYNLNESQSIPWPMYTADQKIERIVTTATQVRIYYDKSATVVPRMNIHVIDKEYLQSDNFRQVVEAIVEPT